MSSKILKCALAAVLASGVITGAAQAAEAGQWIGRIGVLGVFPKSDNLILGPGATVDVDNGYSLGLNLTYMATPNFGIEVVGAAPFKHDIELNGNKVGSTYHLPPTVFLQYHFMPENTIRPYAGIGVNYTFFWSEKTSGALAGNKLDLGSSWGLAGEVGVDVDITPEWFLNASVMYADLDSKAKLNGARLGTVEIDPWVVGFNIGTRF